MPSRFAPRNRLGVRKGKSDMTVSPSSSNGDFLNLDEEGWQQSRVLRCSYRVLQLIGNATLTEKVIRENLGNNPDTSKALRLLLKRKMIKRVGYGGRSCPFHYQSLSWSPSKETEEKAELTSSSSPENTQLPDDQRQDNKSPGLTIVPVNRDYPDHLTEGMNGIEQEQPSESEEVLKLKVSRAPKEPRRTQGANPSPVVKTVMRAGPGGLTEMEIPVPGWRLVDD